ncbi:hypothetical protein [Priestia aryabhattai]|uniref:hypothetical protein n=1 Tax=Priestia aryabhattai TaxID=412384 RepID=UPI0015F42E7A|nr:hypothetical protein [Priestia aryabhattai]
MLKVGSKLIAKPEFLIDMKLTYDKREITLSSLSKHGSGYFIEISGEGKQVFVGHVSYEWLLENFYITQNINYEVLQLLEKTELKSFNAVTVDGK